MGKTSSLTMAQRLTSSADPHWRHLSDMIVQGSISSQEQAEELRAVFAESNMDTWQGHVPAYILSGGYVATPCATHMLGPQTLQSQTMACCMSWTM